MCIRIRAHRLEKKVMIEKYKIKTKSNCSWRVNRFDLFFLIVSFTRFFLTVFFCTSSFSFLISCHDLLWHRRWLFPKSACSCPLSSFLSLSFHCSVCFVFTLVYFFRSWKNKNTHLPSKKRPILFRESDSVIIFMLLSFLLGRLFCFMLIIFVSSVSFKSWSF